MQYSLFGSSEMDITGNTSLMNVSIIKKSKKVDDTPSASVMTSKDAYADIAEIQQPSLFDQVEGQRIFQNNLQENDDVEIDDIAGKPKRLQLLKWIGNKQRFAREIVAYFPEDYGTYFEPFLGSGAVWAELEPKNAVVSDIFIPLVEIWQMLQHNPETVKRWYRDRWQHLVANEKVAAYEQVKSSYNDHPNGADLLFLCRTCYGGVVRFRKRDGYMSTPCGIHKPMPPDSFAKRVDQWYPLTSGTSIRHMDYSAAMRAAKEGDLIYCDPPYTFSQSILYGAQSFSLRQLLEEIRLCKQRGVRVALSIDGTKRSGNFICDIPIPKGLFEREILVNCGRSMLKRFQMDGLSLEEEVVADRLLLTY